MHDEINTWLANPHDYLKGIKILEKHCTNAFLLEMLGKGETFYNRKLLVKELTKSRPKADLKKNNQPAKPKVKTQKAKDTPSKYGRKPKEYYPEELHVAFERQDELYRTVNHLHPQLDLLHQTNQGQCKKACQAIVSAWREINAIYRLLDYWTEHKVVLPHKYRQQQTPDLSDRADKVKRLNALRVYISRNRNDPKKVAKIEDWKRERDALIIDIENAPDAI